MHDDLGAGFSAEWIFSHFLVSCRAFSRILSVGSFPYICVRKMPRENLPGKKNEQNPNCLVRISSGGVGVFRVKGRGARSSVCASRPRETKLFGRISWDFCRDIPGAPEKLQKKEFVFNFWPLIFQENPRPKLPTSIPDTNPAERLGQEIAPELWKFHLASPLMSTILAPDGQNEQ